MPRRIKKFTVRHLEVTDINSKGMGVAKDAEGAVYFIKEAVPGDQLSVEVFRKRRNYFEAKPLSWKQYSPMRAQVRCEHFGVCGGCKWQHLDYAAQLDFKEKEVLHNLTHIGKVRIGEQLPILGADPQFLYRNKMEYAFSNRRWLEEEEIQSEGSIERRGLGFHKPQMWDKIVDIQKCYLQAEPSNRIRNAIKAYAIEKALPFFDVKAQSGFLRTLMIRNTTKGEIMVLLQFYHENLEWQNSILSFIKNQFPEITALLYCINSKANDTLYDQEIECFSGRDYIEEQLQHLRFKITAKSFYQTNPKQAERLYEIVKTFAELSAEDLVFDLYTGTGTIALFLAHSCKKVVGIESVPEAIAAARANAVNNNIDNAYFEVGDMKTVFNTAFIARHGTPDVVICDPPRNGMHPEVVQQLRKLKPKKIVYVSCNSATQARDLALMKDDYHIAISQAVDMFPQTHHVENVVLLKRKENHEAL